MQILITLVGVVNTSIKYLLELLLSVIVRNDIIKFDHKNVVMSFVILILS